MKNKFPTLIVCFSCFLLSIYTFYPGWMSPDSLFQYEDARRGVYFDWHPVLMAWWWNILLNIYDGPQPMLIQNLFFFWAGWFLLAEFYRKSVGQIAAILPLLGLWPGVFFPLGQIWKDIFFAAPVFFCWALLLYISGRRPTWAERITIFITLTLAVGAKPNGIVVLPFIAFYWLHLEQPSLLRKPLQLGSAALGLSALITIIPFLASKLLEVHRMNPFQYTQTYDLLAISVATNSILLPSYLQEKIGRDMQTIRPLYSSGGNNVMYYNTVGPITTTNPKELEELNDLWIKAVVDHPAIYLEHRWRNFMSLLRIGQVHAAYVADATNVENRYGIESRPTPISEILKSSTSKTPWIYFPWIYGVIIFANCLLLALLRQRRMPSFLIAASTAAFVAPHILISPASDFRYLYYATLMALALTATTIVAAAQWAYRDLRDSLKRQP